MSIKVKEEGFEGLGYWISTLFSVPGGLAGGTIGLGCGIKDAIGTVWSDVKTETGNTTLVDLAIHEISSNTVGGYQYGADIGATVGGVIGDCIEAYGLKPVATVAATGMGFYAGKIVNKPLLVGAIGTAVNLATSKEAVIATMFMGGAFMFSSLVLKYCAPKLAPYFMGSSIGGVMNKPLIMGEIGAALTLTACSDNPVISAVVAGSVFMPVSWAMSYFLPNVAPITCAAAGGITSLMLVNNHEEWLDFTFE